MLLMHQPTQGNIIRLMTRKPKDPFDPSLLHEHRFSRERRANLLYQELTNQRSSSDSPWKGKEGGSATSHVTTSHEPTNRPDTTLLEIAQSKWTAIASRLNKLKKWPVEQPDQYTRFRHHCGLLLEEIRETEPCIEKIANPALSAAFYRLLDAVGNFCDVVPSEPLLDVDRRRLVSPVLEHALLYLSELSVVRATTLGDGLITVEEALWRTEVVTRPDPALAMGWLAAKKHGSGPPSIKIIVPSATGKENGAASGEGSRHTLSWQALPAAAPLQTPSKPAIAEGMAAEQEVDDTQFLDIPERPGVQPSTYTGPGRIGKTGLAVYFSQTVAVPVRKFIVENALTQQVVIEEALALYFEQQHRPDLAQAIRAEAQANQAATPVNIRRGAIKRATRAPKR